MTTKVIFRVFVRHVTEPQDDDVIAFFPELAGDLNPYRTCLSYEHTGQHGAATLGFYLESTRPAKPEEYKDLLDELVSIGYDDLKIMKRFTRQDLESRKAQTNL